MANALYIADIPFKVDLLRRGVIVSCRHNYFVDCYVLYVIDVITCLCAIKSPIVTFQLAINHHNEKQLLGLL